MELTGRLTGRPPEEVEALRPAFERLLDKRRGAD